MNTYLQLLKKLVDLPEERLDRTGTGTKALFGPQMRFDLANGFPLLTTKKLHVRSIFHELLWFLSGSTNIEYLRENKVTIWDEWADSEGNLGPVYGKQWRDFGGYDQIKELMNGLRDNPMSRRHLVSAWNPPMLKDQALPPCHVLWQCFVGGGKLSMQLYQRSADFFLGVPFNIASYALLTHMIAQQLDLEVGEFVWTGGDTHLYVNHMEQAKLQLSREPRPLPQLTLLRRPDSLFDYKYEDFQVEGYDPHPGIKAPVAV